ncbi:MAG TPA: secretin N-terminal domain-containing protein, partial [Pseudomonadales bacterium]|nr:secretin N-terminal domain-containing protein [Pseudomonadales bacterium]
MLLSSALAAAMLVCQPSFAEDQTWKVNMKDADIRAFISQVSDITGYSFVLDPNVKGRVTVVSNVSMNKDGIWELFLNVLHVNSYSAVRTGDVIKIVRTQNAKTEPLGLDQSAHVQGAELITRVIQVQNTPAVELVPILRPMIPQYGHLAAITTSNSLLISDHADNVQRMIDIVNRIDSASNDDMDVIQLQNTWVGDVIKMIEELSPGVQSAKAGKAGGSIRVVADEQGNRLIVKGDRDARMRIKTAVAQLDQPGRKGSGTHVVYLRHADAEKTAEVLKGILGQGGGGGGGKKEAAAAAVVGGDVTVQPDKTLNALVIKATPSEMNDITEIIKQLDVRRAQVLIEGAIVEISGDVSDALGVQWGFGDPEKGVGAVQLSAGGQLS